MLGTLTDCNIVNGNARDNYKGARPGLGGLEDKQTNGDDRGQDTIDDGEDGIPKGLIWPGRVRALAAQDKDPHEGQDIKYQHHEDDISQQCVIAAAQTQQTGPGTLYP